MVSLSATRRVFLVGLNTGYISNGLPDNRFVDFYRRRSSPQLYCAIVGNVVIPGGFGSNEQTATIDASPVWETIASAITEKGSVAGIQFSTAWNGYEGVRSFRSSKGRTVIAEARSLVSTFAPAQVERLFAALGEATDLALAVGFRHIQLHAAHGYIFSLLLDSRIFEGAREVLGHVGAWARRASAAGAETSVRISLRTGDAVFDATGADTFQDEVSTLPVDFIDVSSGFYNIDKQLIYPARPEVIADRRAETIALAGRFPARRYIASGRVSVAESILCQTTWI